MRDDLCLELISSTMEREVIAAIRTEAKQHGVITWEELQRATTSDDELNKLAKWVMNGFPDDRVQLPENCRDYWQYRETKYGGRSGTGGSVHDHT